MGMSKAWERIAEPLATYRGKARRSKTFDPLKRVLRFKATDTAQAKAWEKLGYTVRLIDTTEGSYYLASPEPIKLRTSRQPSQPPSEPEDKRPVASFPMLAASNDARRDAIRSAALRTIARQYEGDS